MSHRYDAMVTALHPPWNGESAAPALVLSIHMHFRQKEYSALEWLCCFMRKSRTVCMFDECVLYPIFQLASHSLQLNGWVCVYMFACMCMFEHVFFTVEFSTWTDDIFRFGFSVSIARVCVFTYSTCHCLSFLFIRAFHCAIWYILYNFHSCACIASHHIVMHSVVEKIVGPIPAQNQTFAMNAKTYRWCSILFLFSIAAAAAVDVASVVVVVFCFFVSMPFWVSLHTPLFLFVYNSDGKIGHCHYQCYCCCTLSARNNVFFL